MTEPRAKRKKVCVWTKNNLFLTYHYTPACSKHQRVGYIHNFKYCPFCGLPIRETK